MKSSIMICPDSVSTQPHERGRSRNPWRFLAAFRISVAVVASVVFLLQSVCAFADVTDEEKRMLEGRPSYDEAYSIMARTRFITVPDFILGAFFDRNESTWDGEVNMAFGLEFTYQNVGSYDLVFSVDWTNLATPNGYWLESDDPLDNADFTENTLSLISIDASIYWYTDLAKEVAIYYGAGLGLGILLGDLHKTDIDYECAKEEGRNSVNIGDCPTQSYAPRKKEDDVPPVVPLINVTLGFKFTIADHFVIKLEGGFKGYFFGGLALGYHWW